MTISFTFADIKEGVEAAMKREEEALDQLEQYRAQNSGMGHTIGNDEQTNKDREKDDRRVMKEFLDQDQLQEEIKAKFPMPDLENISSAKEGVSSLKRQNEQIRNFLKEKLDTYFYTAEIKKGDNNPPPPVLAQLRRLMKQIDVIFANKNWRDSLAFLGYMKHSNGEQDPEGETILARSTARAKNTDPLPGIRMSARKLGYYPAPRAQRKISFADDQVDDTEDPVDDISREEIDLLTRLPTQQAPETPAPKGQATQQAPETPAPQQQATQQQAPATPAGAPGAPAARPPLLLPTAPRAAAAAAAPAAPAVSAPATLGARVAARIRVFGNWAFGGRSVTELYPVSQTPQQQAPRQQATQQQATQQQATRQQATQQQATQQQATRQQATQQQATRQQATQQQATQQQATQQQATQQQATQQAPAANDRQAELLDKIQQEILQLREKIEGPTQTLLKQVQEGKKIAEEFGVSIGQPSFVDVTTAAKDIMNTAKDCPPTGGRPGIVGAGDDTTIARKLVDVMGSNNAYNAIVKAGASGGVGGAAGAVGLQSAVAASPLSANLPGKTEDATKYLATNMLSAAVKGERQLAQNVLDERDSINARIRSKERELDQKLEDLFRYELEETVAVELQQLQKDYQDANKKMKEDMAEKEKILIEYGKELKLKEETTAVEAEAALEAIIKTYKDEFAAALEKSETEIYEKAFGEAAGKLSEALERHRDAVEKQDDALRNDIREACTKREEELATGVYNAMLDPEPCLTELETIVLEHSRRKVMEDVDVLMYVEPDCALCDEAKEIFERDGVRYVSFDVSESPEFARLTKDQAKPMIFNVEGRMPEWVEWSSLMEKVDG